ncbi:MAG: (4Fe-4S)-binding protein [Bacteroidota bacterium]|nr:(4Fe-4S)-binding protein [Bacteroidota bacterium]
MDLENLTKKYTNGEVTVVWKPGICIHSAICFKGLPEVFDPRQRPWVKMEGAETKAIVEQIKKCPSGALSYFMNNESNMESAKLDAEIEVIPNGPLIIYGTLKVTDTNGNKTLENKTTAFCRCGGSSNKPFCDGTHKKNGFQG